MPLGEEIPLERGHQRLAPQRNRYFTAISSSSVKTVADRHRLDAYHNKHWWRTFRRPTNTDDLERLWTPTMFSCDFRLRRILRVNSAAITRYCTLDCYIHLLPEFKWTVKRWSVHLCEIARLTARRRFELWVHKRVKIKFSQYRVLYSYKKPQSGHRQVWSLCREADRLNFDVSEWRHAELNFDTEVRCYGLHDHLGWSVAAKSATYILGQVRRHRTSVTSVIIEWKPGGVWSRRSFSFCSAISLLVTPLAKPLATIKLL